MSPRPTQQVGCWEHSPGLLLAAEAAGTPLGLLAEIPALDIHLIVVLVWPEASEPGGSPAC